MSTLWLTANDIQRKIILEQAAFKTGIPIKAIEKDWWVTLCLRALFTTSYAPFCILKGGTSLSKGWGLLQRFPDDIDIALMPESFGMPYQSRPTYPYLERLKRGGDVFVSTVMKKALVAAFEKQGISAPDIAIWVADGKRKDPKTIFIRYRSVLDPDHYLTEDVKMEFGVRNLKDPFIDIPLQSILSRAFPDEVCKEKSFSVQVVAPHKTLLEKMFLLHEKFSGKLSATYREHRQSRHLYDIAQLMNTKAGLNALEDTPLYTKLIQHRRRYARLRYVDYNTLNHAELSFVPPMGWVEEFRKDYESLQGSIIYGESLPFDELMNQLKLFNDKVRLIGTGVIAGT